MLASRYAISAALIAAALTIGVTIQNYFSLAIPGSVIGMLVLFAAMASGLIQPQWVQPSAHFIIRYMIVLFVPVSVGLMQHFELLVANAIPILASAVGGSFIVLVSLSWLLDRVLRRES
ncbi:CidA/LrgA family protein [Vibrio sp. SM6]|uniref:CidA/LrgA family protein n=2 Tax=Vibrio agarilyticus TaxID=2726741 RepID=A0A7X8TQ88_9VIBR|nr:CidA/LrgA family protein [Vibrio agarilyticus]